MRALVAAIGVLILASLGFRVVPRLGPDLNLRIYVFCSVAFTGSRMPRRTTTRGPASTAADGCRIRADLAVLRRAGCDGLVTYGASLPRIVDEAKGVGFKAVLLGVWDPTSEDELRLARHSAVNPIVAGVVVGMRASCLSATA